MSQGPCATRDRSAAPNWGSYTPAGVGSNPRRGRRRVSGEGAHLVEVGFVAPMQGSSGLSAEVVTGGVVDHATSEDVILRTYNVNGLKPEDEKPASPPPLKWGGLRRVLSETRLTAPTQVGRLAAGSFGLDLYSVRSHTLTRSDFNVASE